MGRPAIVRDARRRLIARPAEAHRRHLLEPRLSIIERALIIMDSGFFPGLSTEDMARVAARTTEVHVDAGQMIDYERGIHLLIEGKVEVTLNGRVIRNIAPGDGIGLASVLGVEEHEGFAARASEHAHLLSMCRDDFQDVLTEFPEVAIALLKDNMRQMLGLFRRLQELTGERPEDMPS